MSIFACIGNFKGAIVGHQEIQVLPLLVERGCFIAEVHFYINKSLRKGQKVVVHAVYTNVMHHELSSCNSSQSIKAFFLLFWHLHTGHVRVVK